MEKHHAKRIACQYVRAMEHPKQTFSRSMTKNVSLELMNVCEDLRGILKNRDDPFTAPIIPLIKNNPIKTTKAGGEKGCTSKK